MYECPEPILLLARLYLHYFAFTWSEMAVYLCVPKCYFQCEQMNWILDCVFPTSLFYMSSVLNNWIRYIKLEILNVWSICIYLHRRYNYICRGPINRFDNYVANLLINMQNLVIKSTIGLIALRSQTIRNTNHLSIIFEICT